MQITKTFYAPDQKTWRKWLKKNHKKEKEIWLLFYLKSSKKKGISYSEAVQEAICFGWIDSIVKKIDPERRAQRFTPRNPKSTWSELNLERARLLIKQKKMTKAGLAALGKAKKKKISIPADILEKLKKDPLSGRISKSFLSITKESGSDLLMVPETGKIFLRKGFNIFSE